jgi:DHA2 family methylenomycin A resistance protein-like MFS transporter
MPYSTQPPHAHRTSPPGRLLRRRVPSPALVVICAGYFLVILDATVVNVALPAIGRELHGGVAGRQWAVDAYTLSFAGLLLAGGALAERRSRRARSSPGRR